MNPDLYCAELVLQRGSSLHHALVYLKPEPRAAVSALFALRRELRNSVNASSEPTVAQARLAWWRDEIARLLTGQASHPVTQALAQHAPAWITRDGASLFGLSDAVSLELSQSRFPDEAALERLLQFDYGTLFGAAAGLLGADELALRPAIRDLGVGYALAELIAHVGADARAARIYLPIAELEAQGVPAADILGARPSAALAALLEARALQARQRLAAAYARLDRSARRTLRPLLILAALSLRRLAECERDQFRVLQQRLELTPLRATLVAAGVWLGLTRVV